MSSFYKYVSLFRFALLLGCSAFICAAPGRDGRAFAQTPQPAVVVRHEVQIDLMFEASGSNLDYAATATSFLLGGGAEASVGLYKGIGLAGSVTGLHTSDSGHGVPINLLAFTFGPRYTYRIRKFKHSVNLYGEGLAGEMRGFDGVYPSQSGPNPSANSLAIQVGGGIDIGFSRHISIRAINADWLRSTLPDATTNVQNNLRLGVGFVWHSSSR